MSIITIKFKDDKFMKLLKHKNLTTTFGKISKDHYFKFRKRMNELIRKEFLDGAGNYAPIGVQKYIKGHSNPLVQSGKLGSSVSDDELKFKADGVFGFKVGFYKGRAGKLSVKKLASIIHDGAEWNPTQAQRRALQAKLAAAGAPPPEGDRKSTWKIPARPFLKTPMEKAEVRQSFAYTNIKILLESLKKLAG